MSVAPLWRKQYPHIGRSETTAVQINQRPPAGRLPV
jgi:hypothetical protein